MSGGWGREHVSIRKALLRTTMLSGIVGALYLSGNLARAAESARSPDGYPSWYAPASMA
jgi:hypothetical protein